MTSETFVLGGTVPEKVAIGARVRQFAATLGTGQVEASVVNYCNRLRVCEAHACPLTAQEYDIRVELEQYLNVGNR